MKNLKKSISVILALTVLLSLLSCLSACFGISSIMSKDGTAGLEFYPLPDETYAVSAGTAKYLEEIVIPSEYNKKSVSTILDEAFAGAINLKSITIPDSVTSIGARAFSGCTELTNVTIGNGVTSIGSSAFYGCSGLTSITIPDSVTSIGSSTFSSCNGLTSITISNSVTSIGSSAFLGCTGLRGIRFNGTKAQWNEITKYDWRGNGSSIKTIHCTDGDITL